MTTPAEQSCYLSLVTLVVCMVGPITNSGTKTYVTFGWPRIKKTFMSCIFWKHLCKCKFPCIMLVYQHVIYKFMSSMSALSSLTSWTDTPPTYPYPYWVRYVCNFNVEFRSNCLWQRFLRCFEPVIVILEIYGIFFSTKNNWNCDDQY